MALALFNGNSDLDTAIKQGLPIVKFTPLNFKEGGMVGSQVGKFAILNRAPHPNATKLFINWLLSREGQISFQNALIPRSGGAQGISLRLDTPTDIIPPGSRPQEYPHYLEFRDEMMDLTPVIKFINEVMEKAKK
jgi:ABC-type Fe3+ transport system substrate-binding protein